MESAESLLRDQIPAAAKVNESTKMALQDAVLSPRFYTTNFEEVDKTNIDALRSEWNVLMAEFAADINSDHFQRPANMGIILIHIGWTLKVIRIDVGSKLGP